MKLIIEDDEGHRTVIPFVRDELTIGRHEGNVVRLAEKNVSRKHGRLLREAGRFFIEDLGSFTGIRVNGEKIAGKRLVREGDLIQISEYDLSLQAGPEEKASPPEPEDDEPTVTATQTTQPRPPVQAAVQVPQEEPVHDEADEAAAEADARKKADTAIIRLSDLGMSAPADEELKEVPQGRRPKLVGIAGSWRGKELILDRTPIRIGRSGENDVEIDHPSISRKHCRLHLEGESWKVMDAESKNGVRVNDEPYAAIALRNGDVLEIGHLKFMFASPGQMVVLPAESGSKAKALAAAQVGGGGNRALVLGLGAALVLALGAVAFFATRHKASGTGREEDGEEVVQDSKGERKFALRAAEEGVAAHRYTEAVRHLDAARGAGATAAELRDYNQIQAESRSEDLFREMEGAMATQDFERARKLLSVLGGSKTFYGNKASEKADAVTSGYVTLHLAAAGLMKDKDNAGCLSEAKLALQANPQSTDAQSLVETCKLAPVQAPAVRTSSFAARPAAPVAAAAAARPVDVDGDARKLVNEGNQKLVGQDVPGAIAAYQQALAMKPGDGVLGGIYRSMGIAFTRQGNMEEGAHYYKLYLPLCTNPNEKAQLQKVLDDYEARRR
jgi:pSer/pThr/pTyr-binding forkhead associated (FHA) protein/tetratricopeptide (TPR) repeat protein